MVVVEAVAPVWLWRWVTGRYWSADETRGFGSPGLSTSFTITEPAAPPRAMLWAALRAP